MSKRFLLPTVLTAATLLTAHPMGNFSVSHYARFEPKAGAVDIVYVLDLAELPTFDLLRQWGLERSSSKEQLASKATQQAREWAKHLDIRAGGKAVTPKFLSASYVIADGAGDLPIIRVTSRLRADSAPGTFEYEDHNFPDRAGWKEIVIRPGAGAAIAKASQTSEEHSKGLTDYPQDPTLAPPQDVRASFEWTGAAPVVVAEKAEPTPAAPVIAPIPQPKAPQATAPAAMTAQAAPAGSVVKGDFLSRMLHQRELTLSMILIALVVAFGLGAAHALTPGHGKTIVAAYLVGSRGTLKHAAYLGAMVTFTHTVSVFLLGLATLFLFQYVMPEKITQGLGVVSGLSIVAIGGWMLWKRIHGISHGHAHGHSHGHSHDHGHAHQHAEVGAHAHSHDDALTHSHVGGHTHEHVHAGAHAHTHDDAHTHSHIRGDMHEHTHSHDDPHTHTHEHGKLVHSHGPGGHEHSHDVPDEITWGSLTALAVSGGLVPCESALVLLLSAIALGRIGLGLMLLVAFSIGLAIVLMIIGILVIYAKNLFPASNKANRHPAFRWIPVASAAIVMCVGLVMTFVSMGWVEAKWMI